MILVTESVDSDRSLLMETTRTPTATIAGTMGIVNSAYDSELIDSKIVEEAYYLGVEVGMLAVHNPDWGTVHYWEAAAGNRFVGTDLVGKVAFVDCRNHLLPY